MSAAHASRPRVVLLGGAGLVGRALARWMQREGHYEPLIADLRAPPGLGNVAFAPTDVVHDDLSRTLAGAHAVVHLAAQVNPPHPRFRERMRRLHVGGLQRALTSAVAVGVPHFLLCSSAVVYGAWPDNPLPLAEDHPLRPNPGFPYALDKACQEACAQVFIDRLSLGVVRPAVIYGGEAHNYLSEILRVAPGMLPAIDDRRPPLQFVHVDDVARALLAMLHARASGVFNLGPPDVLSYEEVAALAGCRVVALSGAWVRPALDALAPLLPPQLRAPSYVLDVLQHPFVVSPAKLCARLGFAFRHSSADALRAMLEGPRRRRATGSSREAA